MGQPTTVFNKDDLGRELEKHTQRCMTDDLIQCLLVYEEVLRKQRREKDRPARNNPVIGGSVTVLNAEAADPGTKASQENTCSEK